MLTGKELKQLETLEEIKEIISLATFPCSRDDILKCAKDAHAPERIVHFLKTLIDPSKKFQNVNEAIDYLTDKLDINI